MKFKNSSRILSLVLALMMIVPMITVPTFAEDLLFTQDFENGTLAELVKTSNPSVSIKDLGEDDAHGKVFCFDMNSGPYDNGNLYLIKNQNSGRHKVTEYVTNADGTVSGKVLVTLSGADPVELMFENAVVETQKLNKDGEGALANAVQLYEIELRQKLDENGLPTYDQNTWQPIMEEVKGAEWNDFVGAIVTCKLANACQGGANIATHSYLTHPALEASTVTYSMDINVDHDWNILSEIHGMKGAFRFVSFGRSGNNLIVQPSANLVLTDGAAMLVATDNWFNLSIVADYATATIKVYVNGNYAFTAKDESNASRITAVAGNIPADGLQLIQANRNSAETRFYDGDVMIDNVAIYKGEVLPAASTVSKYAFSSSFNGETVKYNFGSANELVSFPADSNAMKIDLDTYDEETGNDLNAVKAIDRSLFFSDLPAFSAAEGATDYFFEADYYIPVGAEYKLQGQFYKVESAQGTKNWVSIYTIYARGTTAELQPQGELYSSNSIENYNGEIYYTELPVGEWFTMTHKIDLVTGRVEHYVNGELYAYWYLKRSSDFLTNVTVAAGNSGWIVAKPNKIDGNAKSTTEGLTSYLAGHGGSYPNGYSGYLMMDNLAIYTDARLLPTGKPDGGDVDDGTTDGGDNTDDGNTGGVTPPEDTTTPEYIYSADFNSSTVAAYTFGNGGESISFADYMMKIDLDTYDEELGADTVHANAIDQRLMFNDIPELAPTEDITTYFLEVDYYIPKGAEFRIQSQLLNVASDQGVFYWTSLYSILADGTTATFNPHGEIPISQCNGVIYNTELPMGEWFTLTQKINLVTGRIEQYVNGELYAEWNLWRMDQFLTNITIGRGTYGWIVLKANKLTTATNYPNGYSGFVALDNIEVYSDARLFPDGKPDGGDVDDGNTGGDNPGGDVDDGTTDGGDNTDDGNTGGDNGGDNPGEVTPPEDDTTTPEYIYTDDFNNGLPSFTFSNAANGLVSSSNGAVKIDLDTYDEVTGVDLEAVKGIDQNFRFNDLPAMQATEGNTAYFIQADYYIPVGAEYKLQGQLYKVDSDQGTKNWVSVYTIYARGTTAEFQAQGELYSSNPIENYGGKTYHTELPVGEWFTMTHKIDLVTGRVEHYVNGELYAYWYLKRSSDFLTNVTISAGTQGWIVAKPNKINGNVYSTTEGLTSYRAGHGGSYPNGYSGYLMMDNLAIYTDARLLPTGKPDGGESNMEFEGIVTTENIASIRTYAPTGLRFATKVDMEKVELLKALGYTVSFGTLIAPADLIEGMELVHGVLNPLVDVVNVGKFFEVDNDASTTHFVGSIAGIQEGNMTRAFTARGYVKAEKDGEVLYFYSATTHTVSVADQAVKTLESGLLTPGTAAYEVVAAFAAKAGWNAAEDPMDSDPYEKETFEA